MNIIDCHEDPWDLRMPASAIGQQVAALLADATPDKPLVVLVGEHHDMPAQVLLSLFVADWLKANLADSQFVFGYEQPHDYAAAALAAESGLGIEDTSIWLNKNDQNGNISQQAYLSRFDSKGAQKALLGVTFASALSGTNVCVHFNDVSHRHAKCGVGNALELRAWGKAEFPCSEEERDAWTTEMVAYRNRAMAERILLTCKEKQVSLYLQRCGVTHIAGGWGINGDIHPYKEGLYTHLTNRGAHVLPVAHHSEDAFPFVDNLDETVMLENCGTQNWHDMWLMSRAARRYQQNIEIEKISRYSGNRLDKYMDAEQSILAARHFIRRVATRHLRPSWGV